MNATVSKVLSFFAEFLIKFTITIIVLTGVILLLAYGARKGSIVTKDEAEDRRKGFHCLSGWGRSHHGLSEIIKRNLHDPKSFDHIETKISFVNDEGYHILVMRYQAANAFGRLVVAVATANIDHNSCQATDVVML